MNNQEIGKEPDGLVTIAVFPEPSEANLARSELEAVGIPVFLQGETANSMIPVAFVSQLQVYARDEVEARKLLEAMEETPESMESVTAAEIEAEQAAARQDTPKEEQG